MSKSKKPTSLEVVERYHARYLEFEKAFNDNPFNKEDVQEQIKLIVEQDLDEDKQFDQLVEVVFEKQERQSDVNLSAVKFIMFVDYYLMTEENPLPENIQKDYDNIPQKVKESLKTKNSVHDGKFVRNEKKVITEAEKEYLKSVIDYINQST